MFLTLRELWFARTRFLLMGAVVALISILMVILSGLSSGLVTDGVSALQRTPRSRPSRSRKAPRPIPRSPAPSSPTSRPPPGVNGPTSRTPPCSATRSSTPRPAPASPRRPHPVRHRTRIVPRAAAAEGSALQGDTDIIVSDSARDAGIELGDTVILDRLGTELTVVGFTADKRTFGHVDVAYVRCPPGRRSTPASRSVSNRSRTSTTRPASSRCRASTVNCPTSPPEIPPRAPRPRRSRSRSTRRPATPPR